MPLVIGIRRGVHCRKREKLSRLHLLSFAALAHPAHHKDHQNEQDEDDRHNHRQCDCTVVFIGHCQPRWHVIDANAASCAATTCLSAGGRCAGQGGARDGGRDRESCRSDARRRHRASCNGARRGQGVCCSCRLRLAGDAQGACGACRRPGAGECQRTGHGRGSGDCGTRGARSAGCSGGLGGCRCAGHRRGGQRLGGRRAGG
mmetsp:Transcript_105171/g.250385  ORF Transcript_105171/g.250385 Transcript_105171/m.250385 type:complete len:203 (+) Transcript_105171:1103-1711(+)